MKRIAGLLLCVVLLSGLCACAAMSKCESDRCWIGDIYFRRNKAAIDVIIKEFRKDWKGCTLNEIYYAGDETIPYYQDWADRNGADEVWCCCRLSKWDPSRRRIAQPQQHI